MVLASGERAADIVAQLDQGAHVLDAHGAVIRVRAAHQQQVLAALVGAGVSLRSLNPVARTLEDVYLRAAHPDEAERGQPVASAAPASEREGRLV